MGIMVDKILSMQNSGNASGYWAQRILAQLGYGSKISKIKDGKYDTLINNAIQHVYDKFQEESAITKDTALKAEGMILELKDDAKYFHMICCSHAHIDMNWMWRYDETVAITLDTFRTMLNLMDEYPDFTFSQSQASMYKIVAEHDPAMLGEIKQRIKEGRWEVTATTWVETDKNMPSGESLARHILYTKRYLSNLLDLDPHSLKLDFEPDTFGHSMNVPEICSKGGIKYYYHCRGDDGECLYRWIAPSGASLIVYRELTWYNADIEPMMALYVPEFCTRYGMDTMLKVYGVGDHGGGPTRRDIERIMDMNTWPVFPNIRFGRYDEYFELVEKQADNLPVVESDEQNFVFSGCYTSQSRIKMANRIAEATLNESEAFNAISHLYGAYDYSSEQFAKAWQKVLFNQFHDIIPGSGVVDTREHAMGLFQESMAIANTRRSYALRSIAFRINTAPLIPEDQDPSDTISEGAGVGFGIEGFRISQSERGLGKTRVFTFFNPSPYEREELSEVTIWDWNYDLDRLIFKDVDGNVAEHQLIDHGFNNYWGHKYLRVLLKARAPGLGYNTYIMTEKGASDISLPLPPHPRVERVDEFVLENDHIRVEFDSLTGAIVSMMDKETGAELVSPDRPDGIFRFILEDESKGMTSWRVGPYMNIQELNKNVKIKRINHGPDNLRQSIGMDIEFMNSKLTAIVSLDYNSPRLEFDVTCDWQEFGKPGYGIPQLNFHMPLAYKCKNYRYDIPFGTIDREDRNMDLPASSWIAGMPVEEDRKGIMLITDTKYGFRGTGDALAVSLIRGSYDPDPYPEVGINKFKFAVCPVYFKNNKDLIAQAYEFNHRFSVVSTSAHEGVLPAMGSFFTLKEGDVAISGIKIAEDSEGNSNKLIVRVYETEGDSTKVSMGLFKEPSKAYFVDINEEKIVSEGISIDGKTIELTVSPYSIANVCIEF
ncbi:MAG: alpha-mannosidase [Caldicoprobacterales bacterium]|jgi:alpha-mannosidase